MFRNKCFTFTFITPWDLLLDIFSLRKPLSEYFRPATSFVPHLSSFPRFFEDTLHIIYKNVKLAAHTPVGNTLLVQKILFYVKLCWHFLIFFFFFYHFLQLKKATQHIMCFWTRLSITKWQNIEFKSVSRHNTGWFIQSRIYLFFAVSVSYIVCIIGNMI